MPNILNVFLLATTPIGELRAAIPVALTIYKMPFYLAYLVSVLGNLVPVVFLLLFLDPAQKFLSAKSKFFNNFFNWLFKRTRKQGSAKIQKYGWWGLALFVAIPLPITGAWTGSALAFLFKMPKKKAFLAIFTGVLLAGAIVLFLTLSSIQIEKVFGWQTLLGFIAILLGLLFLAPKIIKH